jgi:biopolymer transport protein ExbB
MKRLTWTLLLSVLLAVSGDAGAQDAGDASTQEAGDAAAQDAGAAPPKREYQSLEELLQRVRQGWNAERAENQKREASFRDERNEQKRLLKEARQTLSREEARSQVVEAKFEENEVALAQYEETLRERLGNLGELFGVVRQVSGDTHGNVESSLVSAQIQGREPFLRDLGQSKALPSIESLEKLWLTLHQEATELGKVVRFPATVVTAAGEEVEKQVTRVGAFNAIADGRYLVWQPDVGKLSELPRQPPGIYLDTVKSFEGSTDDMARLAIDVSRGAILALLVDTPSANERIQQGGVVGYAIIVIGALAGLLAIVRWCAVFVVSRKVAAQTKREEARPDNPLGRVVGVYEENKSVSAETLELKLDEAILREGARMTRFLWAIKVVSVVAPLMGLLGTVTGMIRTFQAITLFGTGDPKLMAGGISEALVTTMLGLIVAIPLVFLHALVASNSRGVLEVLQEQAAGFVARRAERDDAVG